MRRPTGSSPVPASSRYYTTAEEPVTTEQNRTKFATYYRDETTALDYADQRYYYRVIGRFLTADPYVAPGAVMNPTEWNRYAYVAGDPVNFWDPSGLCTAWAGTEVCFSVTAFGQPYGLAGIIRSAGGGGAADWGFVMEEEFGGYGEGAGGGARAPIRSADLAMLREAVKEKLAELAKTNCKNYLPLGKMAKDLEDLQFVDVRIAGEMRVHYFIPSSDRRTLREVVGHAFAVILSSEDTIFPWVALGANFFGRPEAPNPYSEQQITLVHELLHYSAQAGDVKLWEKFKLGSLYPKVGRSEAISQWIRDNCPDPN